ncbi:MAG: serine/threonine protein kinase, partial [Labilithrix sp.]|nr:serine/threonine protein kinase [Labilithrix sp.]
MTHVPVLDDVSPPSRGATAPLGLGEVLAGKYRVESLIGAGGMGYVLLATHIELEQQVAVKLMREEALKDAEARARFAREAKVVVRLRGEHVARVTDVGTLESGAPYLVMEYLRGSDLGAVLAERGRFAVDEAVAYLLQICEGVAEAHAAGIVHRDLKPRNVFVTSTVDGRPLLKVLDFGISKLLPAPGSTMDLSLTSTTDVMGSPSYMAPEQLRSARDADERSDLWSLGVMLYETITGQLPWEASSLSELGAMVLRDPLVPMSARCAGVPRELDAVVARCLEKDRQRRYGSVAELAEALEPFARGLAAGSASRIASVMRTSRVSQITQPLGGASAPPPSSEQARARVFGTGGTSVSWGETEPDLPRVPGRAP